MTVYTLYMQSNHSVIQCFVTKEHLQQIKIRAITLGFRGASAYVIDLIEKDMAAAKQENDK